MGGSGASNAHKKNKQAQRDKDNFVTHNHGDDADSDDDFEAGALAAHNMRAAHVAAAAAALLPPPDLSNADFPTILRVGYSEACIPRQAFIEDIQAAHKQDMQAAIAMGLEQEPWKPTTVVADVRC